METIKGDAKLEQIKILTNIAQEMLHYFCNTGSTESLRLNFLLGPKSDHSLSLSLTLSESRLVTEWFEFLQINIPDKE